MAFPETGQHRNTSPAPGGRFNRLFGYVEGLAYSYPFSVVFFSLFLAGLSLWFTAGHLTFNTSRGDLISKDLPYIQIYKNYRGEFQDYDSMIAVVEGKDPESVKAFTETFVRQLAARPDLFPRIFYKIDTGYFKDKALLYLDTPDLDDLAAKLREHRDFLAEVNEAPGLNRLLQSINGKISSGMVESLLTDFLGTGDETSPDETADLSLLIALEKEMVAQLRGSGTYRSPWRSFLGGGGHPLKEAGYLVSDNEKLLYVLIVPNENHDEFTGFKDSVKFLRSAIAETRSRFPGIQVGLTGEDVIASDEMVTTQIDVKKASQIALVGVALLFIVAYRGVVKPLLAVFSLIVAICWSLGYTTLAVGHLNILSVVFTTILIGLGIDFGIHILERYREERANGHAVLPALQRTVQGTGRGNFAGAITTAMAFGGMALTDFIGIVELGWIAAGGVILCMVAMVLLLPALVTLEERWRQLTYANSVLHATKIRVIEKIFEHHNLIIGLCIVSLVPGLMSLTHITFDYNLLNLQAKGTEAVQYELKIIHNAERSTWSAAALAGSLEETRRMHKALKAKPTVGRVESIVSALPGDSAEKRALIRSIAPVLDGLQVAPEDAPFSLEAVVRTMKKIRFKLHGREESEEKKDDVAEAGRWAQAFLDEAAQTDPATARTRLERFSTDLLADYRSKIADFKLAAHPGAVRVEDLPALIRDKFISPNGKYLISVFPAVNIWERQGMERFLKDVREVAPGITGNAVHMYESSNLMRDGYLKGGLYALVAITLYLLLAFRRVSTTLLVLLPVAVGSVWTVWILDLMQVPFNLANLVILPLIIGIGVVNGVHIVHRYREESEHNGTVLARSTGQAVVLSSLTTMIGFGSLMVADHQGIYSLGLVLTVGVGACLVASVTLLPAILKLCGEKGWTV